MGYKRDAKYIQIDIIIKNIIFHQSVDLKNGLIQDLVEFVVQNV